LPVLTESTFLVNYRPVEMIKTELEKILTTKGSIKINKKTNALIVKDVLENIVLINQKFNSIDI
jgi:type II secretory pathway component HofQ